MAKGTSALQELDPDRLRQNPDNPRLVFREEDMNELLESIREVGVRVPVSVYADGEKYVLLDGERRWRCARKLNLEKMPAIIQPKPSKLDNLLMMFNIHNVRVDWDIMPMAIKMGEVRDMLLKEGKEATPKALAGLTGVRLPTVRRALDLLDLPHKYQNIILEEAAKPRNEQKIKVDLFVEVYKSLHVIEKHVPEVLEEVKKGEYVDAMVNKYTSGVVDNVVGYRDLSKIARAELAGVSKTDARRAIVKLVTHRNYSIKDAFNDTVESAYEQRTLLSRVSSIAILLANSKSRRVSDELRAALQTLRREIDRLLGA
jgi:ParB family chromosome partitioning protein